MGSTSTNSIKDTQSRSQTDSYKCPQCGSSRIRIGYPHIECLACGWSEPLIDFPISWDCHRAYCQEFRLVDPGPSQSPRHRELHAIDERLGNIEQILTSLTPEDLRQFKMKRIYDEVQDIRQGLRYTQRQLANSIHIRTKPKKKPARGVEL